MKRETWVKEIIMATDIGWCWIGIIPELLVIEPERFKTPKVVNKEYNKKGIADCPAYQGFYNNIFILKSPVSFTAIPLEGRVEIDSPEIDEPELQNLFIIHHPNEMYDIKKPMFQFNLHYCFVADEPCLMEMLPPFMHMESFPGQVTGGSWNIHSWIRSASWGFVFNDTKKKLEIKRGDPLCYVKFTTPELTANINLTECILTDNIKRELDRKRCLHLFKRGGLIKLMSRALTLRPKKLIEVKKN